MKLRKIIAMMNLLLQRLEDGIAFDDLKGTACVDVGHLHNQVGDDQKYLYDRRPRW